MVTILFAVVLALWPTADAVGAPPARFVWVVTMDTTASVPPGEFVDYPIILARWVLPRVMPGDTVVLLRLDVKGGAPHAVDLDGRRSRHWPGVAGVDAWVRSIRQVRDKDHGTDLGLPLTYLRELIETEGKLGGGPTAYRLVTLTDGIPDRAQTMRPWPAPVSADARVVFLGVAANTEGALRNLSRQAGFDDSTVQVVSFGHHDVSPRAIDQFMGRQADPTLLKKLGLANGKGGR